MKKLSLQVQIYLACAIVSAAGQTDVCSAAEETAPTKRAIHFVLEDEPFVVELPKDFHPEEDLHYAAVVHGFAPLLLTRVTNVAGVDYRPLHAADAVVIASLDASSAGKRVRDLLQSGGMPAWHRIVSKLVEDYQPEVSLARGPIVAFAHNMSQQVSVLQNKGGLFGRRRPLMEYFSFTPGIANPPLQEYALLAPSAEDAKVFAEDFVHVYDEGLVPWLRKLVDEEMAMLKNSREETAPKLAEAEAKIDKLGPSLEGAEQLGDQAISDLKVKRTLLKVELAGVQARLISIAEKIKDKETSAETRGKLVDLKVSADIDRASLTAQQRVLDELIDGQRRLAGIKGLKRERDLYASQIRNAGEGLERCDEILANLKPFQLINDTVEIRPLRFRAK